jgi:Glyoxalase-like domain
VPVWVSAFLDVAASAWPAASEYWSRLTGWPLSVPRGELDEFATLVPPDGDDYLRVQRLGDGPSRIHLDLHVDHLAASCDRALAPRSPAGSFSRSTSRATSSRSPARRMSRSG